MTGFRRGLLRKHLARRATENPIATFAARFARDLPELQAKVNANITDPQLNQMFNGIVARTGGDIDRIRAEVSDWFNGGMDRVSGSYKRKTQFWSFVIALLLTIALNIDSLKIANALWLQPSLVKMIKPSMSAVEALGQFGQFNLPYGWDKATLRALADPSTLLGALLGWLITAVATLFGAPFWFDTLNRFMVVRSTVKPQEKSTTDKGKG